MVGIMAWHNPNINATLAREYFLADLKKMVDSRYNHPSILQWNIFNEGDCVQLFPDVPEIVQWMKDYDPSRNVDTNSGGGANDLRIGDVNDVHTYPNPGSPAPWANQYSMDGEYGGLGVFQMGHEWVEGGCGAYVKMATSGDFIGNWSVYAHSLLKFKEDPGMSVAIFTQATDIEVSCFFPRTPRTPPPPHHHHHHHHHNPTTNKMCKFRRSVMDG